MRIPSSAIPLVGLFLLLGVHGVVADSSGQEIESVVRKVPENIRRFYNDIRSKGHCTEKLATAFWATYKGVNSFSYCGDHLSDYSVIYIQGRKGALADMDIDCNGAQGGPADDGRCSHARSPDRQNKTAFQATVASYNAGITDLNPYVHPYVVFGNDARHMGRWQCLGHGSSWGRFNPQWYKVEPLSVMAVVCGERVVYGVWGDTNGDDGRRPMVGETSVSLATACHGRWVDGGNVYEREDVLYLAFPGREAVPGAEGADWAAKGFVEFERSIAGLGDRLLERVGSGCWEGRELDWGVVVGSLVVGVLFVL